MKQKRLDLISALIAAYYILSPALYLLRLTQGDTLFAAIVLRTMQPLIIASIFVSFFIKNWRLNNFSIIILMIYAYGIFIGFLNGNDLVDILSSFTHYLQGILIYIWVINHPEPIFVFSNLIKKLRKYYLPITGGAIAFIYFSNALLGTTYYLGLATQAMIPLFFWSLSLGNYVLCFGCLSVFFLSGKRSVLAAVVASLSVLVGKDLCRFKINKFVPATTLFSGIAVVALLSIQPAFINRLLNKFNFSNVNLDTFSSGRITELTYAFADWPNNIFAQIFGSGFGRTFKIISTQTPQIATETANIHLSYGNSLLVLGIPLTVLLHMAIFWQILKCISQFNSKIGELRFQEYTLVAHLFLAFFALTLYADPVFWILLALGRPQKRRENKLSRLRET